VKLKKGIEVYLPDTRGVSISRYGKGNTKLGPNVFTYSRLPGRDMTCPGATDACEAFCYAKRVAGPVEQVWAGNGMSDVPPIPDECALLRLHVGGDFDDVAYIDQWVSRLRERPDVQAWVYTRSWRVASLLPALERLRALPNVQMFASVDLDSELPPAGWRRAWLNDDERRHDDDVVTYVCPEETGDKSSCEACHYCISGQKHDVTFIRH
jgi:hypothetical protein